MAGSQLSRFRRLGLFYVSSHTQGICKGLVDTTQGFGKEKPFWSSGWSLGVPGASPGSREQSLTVAVLK